MHLHLYATSWFTLVFEYIYTQQAGSRLYLYLHATTWFTIVFVFTRYKLVHACTCIYTQQAGSRLYLNLCTVYATTWFKIVFVFIYTPQHDSRSYFYFYTTTWFSLIFVSTRNKLVHACICIYTPQPGSRLHLYLHTRHNRQQQATTWFMIVFIRHNLFHPCIC